MIKTGSEILVECLLREGAEMVFGYPGGQIIPVFDAIYRSRLNLILVRHEQGAAHMADGFSRATGKVGVCIATSGPGATNLVTGLGTAYMDSIPMVAITGQVPTSLIGNDAFQEADITGITRSVTKHNFLVKDVKDLARTIREAFYIASTGRPGPVLVDVPADVQRASTEFIWPETVEMRSYKPNLAGHPGQVKKAAQAINEAKQPVLYIGGGVITSNAEKEVQELAKKADIPVTNTLLGIGAFPPDSPLFMGMLGMHGTYYANMAVQSADLIIAVGARFDDRVTGKVSAFAPNAKIVHIDIDPTSISKSVRADIPVVGDAKRILADLLKEVRKNDHSAWHTTINAWRKTHPLRYKDSDNKLRPQFVIDTINKITNGEAIVVTEVGQHQMWAAQFYQAQKPRHFLSSGGLGTMGFGFPAGIGAKMALPKKDVIVIAGDGSIQMNIQEMATAVLNGVNVKIVILNNAYLGMVRQWQELFWEKHYSSVCLKRNDQCPARCNKRTDDCPGYLPDFVKLAEAYGAVGMRITDKKDVAAALKKALKLEKTVVLEFMVENEENVYPMVPGGHALDQILTTSLA